MNELRERYQCTSTFDLLKFSGEDVVIYYFTFKNESEAKTFAEYCKAKGFEYKVTGLNGHVAC